MTDCSEGCSGEWLGNRPLSRSSHHNTITRPSPHEQLKDGFQRVMETPVLDDNKNLNNVQTLSP